MALKICYQDNNKINEAWAQTSKVVYEKNHFVLRQPPRLIHKAIKARERKHIQIC